MPAAGRAPIDRVAPAHGTSGSDFSPRWCAPCRVSRRLGCRRIDSVVLALVFWVRKIPLPWVRWRNSRKSRRELAGSISSVLIDAI